MLIHYGLIIYFIQLSYGHNMLLSGGGVKSDSGIATSVMASMRQVAVQSGSLHGHADDRQIASIQRAGRRKAIAGYQTRLCHRFGPARNIPKPP